MKKHILLQVLFIGFPWSVRRIILTKLLKFSIHPTARVGRSIISAQRVELGPESNIGNFSIIWKLAELRLGTRARIGQLNYVYGFTGSSYFGHITDRKSALIVGDDSAITSRHLIDCTDTVSIGKFTTVAGYRSTLLTHSIELPNSRQGCKPINIGDYCFVGTNVVILGGAVVPNYCVVGAGALVSGVFTEPRKLLAGVPAKPVKDLPDDWKYFTREVGFVR